MKRTLVLGVSAFLSMALAAPLVAEACSRAVYFGLEGQTVTGRTMDWFVTDMDTNLWMYPRGLERNSNTTTPLIWKSRYGSVVTTVYESVSADGLNEKGLVANMLYLAESEYPPEVVGDARPTLPITAWVQYVLDNYATTAEAVEALRKEDFRMVTVSAPTGEPGTVHLSISDASGDSAIFQYIGGSVMLPGTNRASDRFARMSYYINEATQTADPRRAVATVFSVMRNVSVPIGIKIPGQPNIADTLWLTVSDQKNKVYYYQDTNSPSILWAKLSELDFSEGSSPRKLQLDGNPDLAGDQTKNFQPAGLFKFMSPDSPH